MKISKSRKPNQSYSNRADNDFLSILEESKFERAKPYLIGLGIIAILIAIVGSGFLAYQSVQSNKSDQSSKNAAVQDYEDTKQAKCIDAAYEIHKTPDESDPEFYPKLIAGYDAQLSCYDQYPDENSPSARLSIESARQSAIDASGDYRESYLSGSTSSSNGGNPQVSTPSSATYNPSKCEPLNTEAANLQKSASQKKTIYDNAFAERKIYGDFYSQYGNPIDAQRAYDAQEARIKQLQDDWQDTLSKSNAAYSKYQGCRASL